MARQSPGAMADHLDARLRRKLVKRRGQLHAFDRLVPQRTAVVVIDMTTPFVEGVPGGEALAAPINGLTAAMRAAGGVVAWVTPTPPSTWRSRVATTALLGADAVSQYILDGSSGKLTPNGVAPVPKGSGPRHLAFHPSEKWAYLINELAVSVTAMDFDKASGKLAAKATTSASSSREPSGADTVHSWPMPTWGPSASRSSPRGSRRRSSWRCCAAWGARTARASSSRARCRWPRWKICCATIRAGSARAEFRRSRFSPLTYYPAGTPIGIARCSAVSASIAEPNAGGRSMYITGVTSRDSSVELIKPPMMTSASGE